MVFSVVGESRAIVEPAPRAARLGQQPPELCRAGFKCRVHDTESMETQRGPFAPKVQVELREKKLKKQEAKTGLIGVLIM